MSVLSAEQQQIVNQFPLIQELLVWSQKAALYAVSCSPGERKLLARVCRVGATMLREYLPGGTFTPTTLAILADLHIRTIVQYLDSCSNTFSFNANANWNGTTHVILNANALTALGQLETYDPIVTSTFPTTVDMRHTVEAILAGSRFGLSLN